MNPQSSAAAGALVDLGARVTAHLSACSDGPVTLQGLAPLGGGACQDLYRVDVTFSAGPLSGARRLVLRSDARQSLPGSLNRRQEFAVINAAAAAGVRTPAARFLADGLVRPGASAYFLDFVEGEALGRRVLREPALAQTRARLPALLCAELARIHSITPDAHPELAFANMGQPLVDNRGADGALALDGAAEAALRFARLNLDAMREPRPALELAVRWLREHQPAPVPLTLCHGDFRTGNFLCDPQGLQAVLDWEFSHFGDPMEDLGWLCVRDWRFGQLKRPAGGFASRAALYEAYEQATGRAVDPARVHYWEVMGNVRWACGSVHQGERYRSGEESDLELCAIARRAGEMEYEALRLMERGAQRSKGSRP